MLSKEDREEIAKLIAQNQVSRQKQQKTEDSYKGASKKEREKLAKDREREERILYLTKLNHRGKDTLAQRLELEKLKVLDRTPSLLRDTAKSAGKVIKTGAHLVGDVADATSSTIKSTANSKLSQDLLKSVMYSNPITALIAENSGLLKGLGKGVLSVGKLGLQATGAVASGAGKLLGWGANKLYQKFRKGKGYFKDSNDSSVENMLEQKEKMNSFGGTNYISAQKATFIGGTNHIYLGGMSGASGMFQQKGLLENTKNRVSGFIGTAKDKMSGFLGMNKTAGLIGAANIPLLPGPKKKDDDVIEMTKGIDGIYKEAKKSNKFLEILGKKQLLIVGGIMLAVGAIFLLAKYLKEHGLPNPQDLFNDNTPPEYKENFKSIAKASFGISALDKESYNNFLDENTSNKTFTGISDTKVLTEQKDKTGYKQQGREYITGSLTPIICPFDGYVDNIRIRTGSLKGGPKRMYCEFQLHGQVISKNNKGKTVTKYVVFKYENTLNPQFYKNSQVFKGQHLAYSDGSFKITQLKGDYSAGKDILDSYQTKTNEEKESGWIWSVGESKLSNNDQNRNKIAKTVSQMMAKKQQKEGADFSVDRNLKVGSELITKYGNNYNKALMDKLDIKPVNAKKNITVDNSNITNKTITKAKDNQQQIKQNQKQENINGEKSSYNTNQPANTTIALGSSSNDSSIFTPSVLERTNMYPDTMSLYSTSV